MLDKEFEDLISILNADTGYPKILFLNKKHIMVNNQEQLIGMIKEICVIQRKNISLIKYYFDDKPTYRMEYGREYI